MAKNSKINEKQKEFCSNLLKLQMHYDVNRWQTHLTIWNIVINVKVSFSQSTETASEGVTW